MGSMLRPCSMLQPQPSSPITSVFVFFAAGIQSFKLDTTSLLLSVLTKFRFQISTLFIAEAVFYSSSIAIPLVYHQNTKAADTRCLS